MKHILLFLAAAAVSLLAGCNSDGVIYDPHGPLPVITLDTADGCYTVKVGRQLTITPAVENADGASYEWILGSQSVGTGPSHTFTFDEAKIYYATFCVTTAAGTAQADMSIEAVDQAVPVISLALGSGSVQLLPDAEYTFRPTIKNSDAPGFRCEWLLNGTFVSDAESYTFRQHELGSYTLTIRAETEDGSDSRDIAIEVVERLPQSVRFAPQSYMQSSTDRSTVVGRPLYLKPMLENFGSPTFAWYVDGEMQEEDGATLRFVTERAGTYRIGVDVADRGGNPVHAEVTVHCAASVQSRPKTSSSVRTQNRVYEYIPAPGQFINETQTGGFDDGVTTHEAAVAYAETRLAQKRFVSLGGFGGYIIVGFDHSIANGGGQGYDFSIQGNAFLSSAGGSNEPGIVWVMQDTNGNGLPDDEWYELRGSESGADGTLHDYAVTYYRPEGAKMAVRWRDSQGREGTIDYIKTQHRQDFYYPLWIGADSYTLRGTRLEARNSQDTSGNWHNSAYDWGYADNYGQDNLSAAVGSGGEGQSTGFRISNAVHADGSAAELEFIDFVKVQTALNTKSGALGENSTEVFSFDDLSM